MKAKTLQEFIALAKAEPGKLAYASSGPGTPYHMAVELFKSHDRHRHPACAATRTAAMRATR